MPELEMFRKRQKWIFWAVAILVIPSFALVWGVGGNPNPDYHDPDVLVIGRKTFRASEMHAFRQRLMAATGRMYDGSQASTLLAMTYAELAREAGLVTSPLEEGTFLRREHPVLADAPEEEFDAKFAAERARYELSAEDFRQGVQDWLAVQRLMRIDNQLARPSDDTAYARYALTRAKLSGKRLRFPFTEEAREAARARLAAMPEEERLAELRRVAQANVTDDRFRVPARFRFEYLLVPYATYPAERLTENDERAHYDRNRNRFQPRSFDEAREDVRAEAFQEARRRHAAGVVRTEVDALIARTMREEGSLSLDELARQRNLTRAGVLADLSGPEAMTVAELEAMGVFAPDFEAGPGGPPSVAQVLTDFDRMPEDKRAERLARWRRDFDTGPAAASAQGRLRLRLLDYVPSEPPVEDAGGRLPPAIAQAAADEWVRETVEENTRVDAEVVAVRIRGGEAELLAGGEDQTWSYAGEFPTALWDVPVGGVTEPIPYRNDAESGVELLALVAREAPGRADWAGEDTFMRTQYRNAATRDFTGRPMSTYAGTFMFQPSAFYQTWFMDEAREGRLWFAPAEEARQ